MNTARDRELDTELLDAELPDARFIDSSYLHWLYDCNPLGRGFTAHGDDDGIRVAHYALVPQRYRDASGPAPMVFSLNAVTRSGGQRRGWFTTLGEQVFAEAAGAGVIGVIGVSNANSTPPVVRKLDFRLLGPLPVRVLPALARPRASVEHLPVDAALLGSERFATIVGDLDEHPAVGWTNCWTVEQLRWRLGAPNMASPYWLHVGPDLTAVSALHHVAGRAVPVVLKLLPRGAERVVRPAMPLVSALCRYHRSPFAVYAGFNRMVRVHGARPPRRLLPAPLNLIFRSLSPELPKEAFVLDTFEFLDMDAY